VKVRGATAADFAAVRSLHAEHGAEFEWPDMESASTMAVMVVEDGGAIVGAVVARRTAEIVMAVDRAWRTPMVRWAAIEAMQAEMGPVLLGLGVNCGYCWIPPRMKGWMRRLSRRLGWRKSDWVCMEHEL